LFAVGRKRWGGGYLDKEKESQLLFRKIRPANLMEKTFRTHKDGPARYSFSSLRAAAASSRLREVLGRRRAKAIVLSEDGK